MKILHVIPSIDQAAGGMAEALRQLVPIYKLGGHTVDVASLDAEAAVAGIDLATDVIGLGPGLGTFGYSRRAGQWFAENIAKYDVVLLNGVWQYDTLAAYWALMRSGVPFAIFAHGMLDPYFRDRFPLKHWKKLVYWHLFLRRILERADAVLFTSEEEKQNARQSFGRCRRRELVVPLGSAGPPCDLVKAADAFIKEWPALRGGRVALFMGRIDAKKGIDLLLRAFSEALAVDSEWRLAIAGPDSSGLRGELERVAFSLGIGERVTWTGMLTGDAKWGAYASAEVFTLPSHHENFGMVIAEAMACGVPVIISNKVNIWREVESHGAGLVCDDTVAGLSRALLRWASFDEAETAEFRMRSKRCFEERFSYEPMAKSALEIVAWLAAQRRVASARPVGAIPAESHDS